MKRMLTAVLLLAVSAAICIASTMITTSLTNDITAEICYLREASASGQSTETEQIERVRQKWERYALIISIYTRHDEVERVSEAVELLPALAEEESAMLFRLECANILAALEHLNMTEKPTLSNIL